MHKQRHREKELAFGMVVDGKTQPQLVRDRARILEKQSKAKQIVHSTHHLQYSNQQPAINDDVVEVFWLRNDLYFLKQEDEQILLSNNAWLNDRIMDVAQRLICKEIGTMDSYQSVLNLERKTENPYQPVSQERPVTP